MTTSGHAECSAAGTRREAICERRFRSRASSANISLMQQALGLGGGIQSVVNWRHLLGLEPHIYPGCSSLSSRPAKPMRANRSASRAWGRPHAAFVTSMKGLSLGWSTASSGRMGTFRAHEQTLGRTWIGPTGFRSIPHAPSTPPLRLPNMSSPPMGDSRRRRAYRKSVVAARRITLDEDFYATFYPDSALPGRTS